MAISLTLYELTAEQKRIEDMLIDNGGEITPELEELLNSNAEALTAKVDGYNKILRRLEGSEAAIDAEIKRLTALKKTTQTSQKSIKEYLIWAMENAGLERLDGTLCKAYLRHTTPLEVDEDTLLLSIAKKLEKWQKTLPPYITLSAKANKTTIKELYPKDSSVLPTGCQYVENTTVTIR